MDAMRKRAYKEKTLFIVFNQIENLKSEALRLEQLKSKPITFRSVPAINKLPQETMLTT